MKLKHDGASVRDPIAGARGAVTSREGAAHLLRTRRSPGAAAALAALICLGAVYLALVRPYHMRWGATDAEVAMAMPGDPLIAADAAVSTRAVTIHAPAATVWAWLVQTGQNRGGDWHSYAWLENLFAAEMVERDALDPQLQALHVGDRLFMHAAAPAFPAMAVEVMGLEPGRALWLRGGWSFVLRPVNSQTTRLIVRYPMRPEELGHPLFSFAVFEPAHFVMESGMLLGLKQRAERDPWPAVLVAGPPLPEEK